MDATNVMCIKNSIKVSGNKREAVEGEIKNAASKMNLKNVEGGFVNVLRDVLSRRGSYF
jgi:hypothetical protein